MDVSRIRQREARLHSHNSIRSDSPFPCEILYISLFLTNQESPKLQTKQVVKSPAYANDNPVYMPTTPFVPTPLSTVRKKPICSRHFYLCITIRQPHQINVSSQTKVEKSPAYVNDGPVYMPTTPFVPTPLDPVRCEPFSVFFSHYFSLIKRLI